MAGPTSPAASWPRAVVFDLDGTLVDSVPDITDALNVALAPLAIEVDAAAVRRLVGEGAERLVEDVLAAAGRAPDGALVGRITEAYADAYAARPCVKSVCYPGALDALVTLAADGVKLGICTNKLAAVADAALRRLGLAARLDVVVAAGRYPLKPDPAPLRACFDALGVAPDEALYIGDMAVDVEVARRAGVAVLVADFGYARVPPAALGADGVLVAWADLAAAIAALRRDRAAPVMH